MACHHPLTQSGSTEFKTLVDIGAEVYCQAKVPDTSRVYISVGLGFHVESTLDEVKATPHSSLMQQSIRPTSCMF